MYEMKINEYLKSVEQSRFTVFDTEKPLKTGVDLGTAYIVITVLDMDNRPVACALEKAHVLKDGVVVDYMKALDVVKMLKRKLEGKLKRELRHCAIAMPSGTESSVKTHCYVAEGAGFEVTNVLDEPTAANAVFRIRDGAVADIGGGTTGLALFREGKVVRTEDEPTGGTHLTLVLAGHHHISYEEAERMKCDCAKHSEVLPIVRPVLEKMGGIIRNYTENTEVRELYLCGGTCCLNGMEAIIQKETALPVFKPEYPFLVTPAGIAMNCEI